MKRLLLLAASSILFLFTARSQNSSVPILEREVTVHYSNQTVETILNDISRQAGFVFSYSPDAISDHSRVTIHEDRKPVKLILNRMFSDDVAFRSKGKYVILRKNPSKRKEKTYEGYIYDINSGIKLSNVSVYNKDLRVSAVTDQYGYFRMEVPSNKRLSSLQISKLGYSDTLVASMEEIQRNRMMEILMSTQDTTLKKRSSVLNFKKFVPQWLVPNKMKVHSMNLNESLFHTVQISFIPFVSTNQLLTGNTVNDLSFNMTAGYVYGVKKAEFGSILNIVQTDAGVCQLGGVGNIVGGNSTGFQGAGVINYTHTAKGVQSAGVMNIATDSCNVQLAGVVNKVPVANFQAAGVLNLSKASNVQLSGVFNLSETSQFQAAGVQNSASDVNAQIAGTINTAKEVKTVQVAGVGNISESAPVQVAGSFNIAKEIDIQVSGIFNKASIVKKLQVAPFNFADSCSGIPIGVFSYVRKGYHRFEFFYDDISTANVAFRSGVKLFHTILMAGMSTSPKTKGLWTIGYGIGTSLGNPDKLLLDIDLTANNFHINMDSWEHNFLPKAYIGLDWRIFKHISLAGGVSYNLFISKTTDPHYLDTFVNLPPYTLSDHNSGKDLNLKNWIGWKVGVRVM